MDMDPDGWHLDCETAVIASVEVFPTHHEAVLSLEALDGELGAWTFPDFPVDDFMGRGLNIIGPWLNLRGLAYDAWQEPDPLTFTAVVYRYEGPEVDARILERRATRG